MGIGFRIKEARENLGLTQTELGKLVGVTGSAITNYENETSHPKEPIMYRLIETLKVDANYLFQDCVKLPKEVNDVTLSEYNHIKKYRFISEHSPDGAKVVDMVLDREYFIAERLNQATSTIVEIPAASGTGRLIEYYRSVSAGTGQVIFDDVYPERITIPNDPKYKRAAYAVKVSGHSMEPTYSDGDTLLIEPTCEVDIGEIGIYNVGGQAFVKKLGHGELISLNKEYGNIKLTEESVCMGRVLDKL